MTAKALHHRKDSLDALRRSFMTFLHAFLASLSLHSFCFSAYSFGRDNPRFLYRGCLSALYLSYDLL